MLLNTLSLLNGLLTASAVNFPRLKSIGHGILSLHNPMVLEDRLSPIFHQLRQLKRFLMQDCPFYSTLILEADQKSLVEAIHLQTKIIQTNNTLLTILKGVTVGTGCPLSSDAFNCRTTAAIVIKVVSRCSKAAMSYEECSIYEYE